MGLLLLRLVAGAVLVIRALPALRIGPAVPTVLAALAAASGLLLLSGLWTPVVGVLVALFGIGNVFSRPGDPWAEILLAAIGAGLALVGPGAWSVDARLFGWKRLDVPSRKN